MRQSTPFVTVVAIVLAVFLNTPAVAQLVKNPFGGNRKEPAPAAASKPQVDDRNAEEFYLDMKDFAEGLYHKQVGEGDKRRESDFKRKADTEYENLKRSHAQRAYEVNRSAKSEVVYVVEDRYRVFSGLYDNLLVQDLLNRTGQSIIPTTNEKLYTFKLIADPIPRAETLSTGTVYVTTGLVALLDTKAQLAYVLAHEAAHVYRAHFKTEIMINLAAAEYAAQQQADKETVQRKWALVSAIGGATIGGIAGGSASTAILGGLGGAAVGTVVAGVVQPSAPMFTDWNRVQEDEADQTALAWVLAANQNAEEIPKVFQALKDAGDRDDRVTLGFLGRSSRVRERLKRVEDLLAQAKSLPTFPKGPFGASDPEFDLLMAEVKRDNGVLAYQYDMLDVARDNLKKAVRIKTTDPTALYFYGKILQATARTEEERTSAQEYFRRAADNDQRNMNFGAHLHKAVAMLNPNATSAEKSVAVDLLKKYLEGYYLSMVDDRQAKQDYPPHIETIYDYMSRLGEFRWVLDGQQARRDLAQAKMKSASVVETADRQVSEPVKIRPVVSSPKPSPPKKPGNK